MNKILDIQNISKVYHTLSGEIDAISDCSFSLCEGEFVSIVGPSGCGKSTLLSILSGLEKASSGSFSLKENCTIGYMLQTDSLFPWLTILDNAMLGLKIKKMDSKENREYVIELLETYGLKDFLHKYPSELSGGMKQRVALIRTLALKPDILLLDEPFSALDYQSRLAVSDDVFRILKEQKKSAIMVTHDLSEAISMSNRVIVFSKRPCQIKNIYDIKLTNQSTPIENRKAKEFATYYDFIWKDLDVNV